MTVWPAVSVRWVSAQSGHRSSGSLLRPPGHLVTRALATNVHFGSRPCKNSAKIFKRSSRARFFAIFSALNALRPRESERNKLV